RKAPEIAKNPKIQTRLSRAMRHPALSGLIVQTFPSGACIRVTPQVFTPLEHVQALADAIVEISVTG
ncbi:hypothetical protein LN455_01285, partial [Xanthomonas campestris]|nr:hypothetical protein [Xanthomonas campestris]